MAKIEITEKWQKEWMKSKKAEWTRIPIPTLKEWLEKENIATMNYYTTQLLTGHGCFNSYRYRINKISHQKCGHCEAEVDDPEHTIFECTAWSTEREEMKRTVAPNTEITKNNLIKLTTANKKAWETFSIFAKSVMEEKMRKEREEERQNDERDRTRRTE
ncbi:uncharacterized protein LOC143432182 [Xylocopa sonorina]|uniref:uncharacterized protein LOC143432182 n=1 Tax=Xylocopa sonorina TaxID=1818115 RepID=UPI00403AB596